MATDPVSVARVFAAVWHRLTYECPLERRGDELELAEFVLKAWDEADVSEGALQALSALTMLLPAFVLTEVTAASDDPELSWLASFEVGHLGAAVERAGIAAWCQAHGFPLQLSDETLSGVEEPATPLQPEQAFAFIRQLRDAPQLEDELAAHDAARSSRFRGAAHLPPPA